MPRKPQTTDAAVETPATVATKAPKASKATSAKASPAASTNPAAKGKTAKKDAPAAKAGEYGIDRSRDTRWTAKKVAVFQALRQLKAVGATSARSAKEVAEKAGNDVTARDVRHYCYHAKAAGLAGVVELEDMAGYGFHLTAAGAKVDLKTVLNDK